MLQHPHIFQLTVQDHKNLVFLTGKFDVFVKLRTEGIGWGSNPCKLRNCVIECCI